MDTQPKQSSGNSGRPRELDTLEKVRELFDKLPASYNLSECEYVQFIQLFIYLLLTKNNKSRTNQKRRKRRKMLVKGLIHGFFQYRIWCPPPLFLGAKSLKWVASLFH